MTDFVENAQPLHRHVAKDDDNQFSSVMGSTDKPSQPRRKPSQGEYGRFREWSGV